MMNGEVKQERTGWRDEALSRRHRKWGFDCPAVDLDFLLLEYDAGRAAAIIEYKHEKAQIQWSSHPSYRAIVSLGTDASLPVFAVRYAEDFSWWKVTPLNPKAKDWTPMTTELTEEEYLRLLYRIRGRELPGSLMEAVEL
jgi:hypothetical protein